MNARGREGQIAGTFGITQKARIRPIKPHICATGATERASVLNDRFAKRPLLQASF